MAFDKDILKQVINIGPDEEFITINKVAEICSNIVGFNQKPIYVPDRPQEVKHAVCSSDKARKLLNYKTTIDVKNGILKTYEYINPCTRPQMLHSGGTLQCPVYCLPVSLQATLSTSTST